MDYISDDILRLKIKQLKVFQGISYKEVASMLEVKPISFYSWVKGKYNFSKANKVLLRDIIEILEE